METVLERQKGCTCDKGENTANRSAPCFTGQEEVDTVVPSEDPVPGENQSATMAGITVMSRELVCVCVCVLQEDDFFFFYCCY